MIPSTSSHEIRICFATALKLDCFSQSIASPSKSAVKREPDSAHDTGSCLIPWVGQLSRGTRACTKVLNWQVSR
jgi:hypothetical protein